MILLTVTTATAGTTAVTTASFETKPFKLMTRFSCTGHVAGPDS